MSPYSYFAFLHLQEKRAVLNSYGVDIEFHPVFLGGINVGSGNKPPWTLPAKAAYSPFDLERAKKHFGTPNVKRPDFFPILSLLVSTPFPPSAQSKLTQSNYSRNAACSS